MGPVGLSRTMTSAMARARFDAAVPGLRRDCLTYLRRRVRQADVAEDLTQETLVRLLSYRENPDIESHTRLMYRIAQNLIIEFRRARGRRHAAQHVCLDDAGTLQAPLPPVEEVVEMRSTLVAVLARGVPGLPAKCRQAFELNRFDGLTYDQIAARMGISIKMVEKHISRALSTLRAATS